jgi:membrane-bound lytic murein transglycosylase D
MRQRPSARVAVLLTVLPLVLGAGEAAAGEVAELKARLARLERVVAAGAIFKAALPPELRFGGERVPLQLQDVRERVERELYVALSEQATLTLWQKRAGRVFPLIEAALRRHGLPEDLKYVAVVESGLRAGVRSSAGAVGPWQFIRATGREHGLAVGSEVDQRRDWERSTDAAARFLKRLHKRFGSWALALAAYNAGPSRVARALKTQGVTSFWDLSLPNEAQRYVPRIAIVAHILRHPERYGAKVSDGERWSPRATRTVTVHAPRGGLHLVRVARAARTTYRHLRLLNPHFTSPRLPAGSREIHIPVAGADGFKTRFAKASPPKASAKPRRKGKRKAKAKAKAKPRKRHKVKPGESLWHVAKRHRTTVAALSKLNRLRDRDRILAGQWLKVR